MKFPFGLFVIGLGFSLSLALPAGNPTDDVEILTTSINSRNEQSDDVEPDFKDFSGVVDTGITYPGYSPFPVNTFSFLDYFQDIFRSIREGIERRIWSEGHQGDVWSLDSNKTNSTSVIKAIDGHEFEINDTIYKSSDDDGNAVFNVRVIQIRPVDLDDSTDSSVPQNQDNSDNETEKSIDNEVNKNIDSPEVKYVES